MMDETTNKSSELGLSKPALNRRRLLKVAVATAPIIATLPTGAALARSSNLIGPTSGAGTDAFGRTQCLDVTSGDGILSNGMVDLGAPDPNGFGVAITERNYLREARGSADPISEKQMCQDGGTYYYQGTGWQNVNVPKGIVVSATALSSFVGSIYLREI
jgi:hypothetical protein